MAQVVAVTIAARRRFLLVKRGANPLPRIILYLRFFGSKSKKKPENQSFLSLKLGT